MNPPFRLDQHPRRARPLPPPPPGYFDRLPTRVMARLPLAGAGAGFWDWCRRAWSGAARVSLAATVLITCSLAIFWVMSRPPIAPISPTPAATARLDRVPRQELVGYLLDSGAAVEATDLAALAAAHPALPQRFLRPSPAELDAMLDAQPLEEPQYL